MSYAVRFRAPDLCFSISKTNDPAYMQSKYAKSDRKRIDRESDVPSRRILAGHQIFYSKNGIISNLKMLFMTANSSSRTIDELDGDRAV